MICVFQQIHFMVPTAGTQLTQLSTFLFHLWCEPAHNLNISLDHGSLNWTIFRTFITVHVLIQERAATDTYIFLCYPTTKISPPFAIEIPFKLCVLSTLGVLFDKSVNSTYGNKSFCKRTSHRISNCSLNVQQLQGKQRSPPKQ